MENSWALAYFVRHACFTVKHYHCFALSLSQIGSQPRDQERVHTLPLRLLRGEGINETNSGL